eukprot:scaffold15407_cov58-Attheya_sp.AAC.1
MAFSQHNMVAFHHQCGSYHVILCFFYEVREALALKSRATQVKNKLTSNNKLITLFFHAKVSLFLRKKIKLDVAPTVDLLPKTTMATLDNDHPPD